VLTRDAEVLRWRGGRESVLIEPWGADSLRVRGTVVGEIRDDQPGALLPPKPATAVTVTGDDDEARITNGAITATMTSDGRLSFLRTTDGSPLLTEAIPHFSAPPTRRYTSVGGGAHRFEMKFDAVDGERFYGLGQHQHGRLDNKGAVIDLAQRNTEVSIPFLTSSLGYGFLWNHPGIGRVGGPVKWGVVSASSSAPDSRRKRICPDLVISAVRAPLVMRAVSPEESPRQVIEDFPPDRPSHPEAARAPWLNAHDLVSTSPLQCLVTVSEDTHANSLHRPVMRKPFLKVEVRAV
jgi:hypothetical protein